MIGAWSTAEGQVVEQEPLQLHPNFYRAISEAQAEINGTATVVNYNQKWAVISDGKNKRIIVCEK